MKISFLFGAGADADYGICCGDAFRKELIKRKYKEHLKSISKELTDNPLIYPQSQYVFLQTIYDNQDKANIIWGKEKVKQAVQKYQGELSDENKKQEVRKWCGEWHDALTKENDVVGKFFLRNMVFFDTLDEKMNALRYSHIENRGKRIINAYWSIYVLMLHEVYDMENLKPNEFSLPKIFEFLQNDENRYNPKIDLCKTSYYKILNEHLGANLKKHVYIATTNYTPIMENVIETEKLCGKEPPKKKSSKKKSSEKIAYLHGRLNWFEDRTRLTIYDCADEEQRKNALRCSEEQFNLIPFILIPSGVKPLICDRQVREVHKFVDGLDDSGILCIVGYRFNSEDNHINALISEWLKKDSKHRLIYFNFCDEEELNPSILFNELMWIDQAMPIKRYSLAEDIPDNILLSSPETKIFDIYITQDSALQRFSDILEQIEKKM